jgi:hypothetical protein
MVRRGPATPTGTWTRDIREGDYVTWGGYWVPRAGNLAGPLGVIRPSCPWTCQKQTANSANFKGSLLLKGCP